MDRSRTLATKADHSLFVPPRVRFLVPRAMSYISIYKEGACRTEHRLWCGGGMMDKDIDSIAVRHIHQFTKQTPLLCKRVPNCIVVFVALLTSGKKAKVQAVAPLSRRAANIL